MLPKKQKIQRQTFLKVLKLGKSLYTPNINLKFFYTKTKMPKTSKTNKINKRNKFSFVVSKEVTKKANQRNLLKRRGYYTIKKHKGHIKDTIVAIFFFKKGATKLSFQELEKEILFLLKKAGILKHEQ